MNKGLDCFALTITIIGAINWGLIGIFQTVLHALMGISLAIDYLNRVSGGDICTEIAVTGSTFVYDPFNAFTLCSGILRPAGLIAKLKAGVRQLCGIYNGYLAGCGLAAIHRGGSDDCAADTARVNTTVIHISYIGIAAAPERITGFKNANEAAEKLGKVRDEVYKPNPDNVAVYDKLYQEYKTLHKYFGTGENDVMKRLNKIREDRLSE